MKKRKLKFKRFLLKVFEEGNLQILFGFIFLYLVFVFNQNKTIAINDFFDLTLITSLIFLFIIKIFNETVSKKLKNQLEDTFKLEHDYEKLIKKYPLAKNFVTYENVSPNRVLNTNSNDTLIYKFPILKEYTNEFTSIKIIDNKDQWFKLPEIVKENYSELFSSHSTSSIYNQTNIRLDNMKLNGSTLELFTSRTTYYDSLVTNRAIDFEFSSNLTLRELLNPGPYVKRLSELKLSNHIGFNVFIETADTEIILVKRSNNVSIGKGIYGSSVAASLKTRYCLNDEEKFTITGLEKAVEDEISDELGIEIIKGKISLENNLIAVYRDLLEGGKPQLLFGVKVNETSEKIKDDSKIKCIKENKTYENIQDGEQLEFIKIDSSLHLSPDEIIYKDKKYDTLPSVSGSLALFINELKRRSV